MKRFVPLFVLTAVLILPGCTSKPVNVPLSEPVGSSTGQSGAGGQTVAGKDIDKGKGGAITEESLAAGAKDQRGSATSAGAGENQLAPELRDIFFEFDSYTVRTEDVPTLKAIAAWLSTRPKIVIAIEGHCDERGTTDYNLALGQKRAEAAKDYLARMGVSEKQLKTVSYGKEAPIDLGHTEQAWQKNRRVHFVGR